SEGPLDLVELPGQVVLLGVLVALGDGGEPAGEVVERAGERRELGVVGAHPRSLVHGGVAGVTGVASPRGGARPVVVAAPFGYGTPVGGRVAWPRMLQRLDLRGVDDLEGRLPRPQLDADEPVSAVREIIADVRQRGDEALLDCTERFDGVRLERLRVPPEELATALRTVTHEQPAVAEALEAAAGSIRRFHETQL